MNAPINENGRTRKGIITKTENHPAIDIFNDRRAIFPNAGKTPAATSRFPKLDDLFYWPSLSCNK